jgi:hypothetical protein
MNVNMSSQTDSCSVETIPFISKKKARKHCSPFLSLNPIDNILYPIFEMLKGILYIPSRESPHLKHNPQPEAPPRVTSVAELAQYDKGNRRIYERLQRIPKRHLFLSAVILRQYYWDIKNFGTVDEATVLSRADLPNLFDRKAQQPEITAFKLFNYVQNMNQLKMKKMYNKHCIKNGVKKALKWILKKFYNDNYERMSKIIRNLLKNISTRRAPNVVYVDEQKCVELIFFNKYYGTAYKTHGPDNDALIIETDMNLLNKFFYEKDPWNACRGDHIQVIKDKKLLFSPKDVNHDFISKIISNNFVRNSILFYLDNYFLEAHITKIPISVNKIIERIKATLFQEDEKNIKQVWKLQGVSEWGPDFEVGPNFEVHSKKNKTPPEDVKANLVNRGDIDGLGGSDKNESEMDIEGEFEEIIGSSERETNRDLRD